MYILFCLPLVVASFIAALICIASRKGRLAILFLLVGIVLNVASQSIPVRFASLPGFGSLHRSNNEGVAEGVRVRVLQYNMHSEGEYIKGNRDSLRAWLQMVDSVDADVLCLAEYDYGNQVVKRLGDSLAVRYPFKMSDVLGKCGSVGDIVFSRFPITEAVRFVDSDSVLWRYLSETSRPEWYEISNAISVFRLKVLVEGRPVNVFHCHLYSNKYSVARGEHRDSISWVKGLDEYMNLTRIGYGARAIEAEMLRDSIARYDGPTLVCGDFNDLCGSYALRTIMGDRLRDAWWEAGCGPGFTYTDYHLLLRLDHVLCSREFECRGCWVLDGYDFSDHRAVVAELGLR